MIREVKIVDCGKYAVDVGMIFSSTVWVSKATG
jgi:hypothetical protein